MTAVGSYIAYRVIRPSSGTHVATVSAFHNPVGTLKVLQMDTGATVNVCPHEGWFESIYSIPHSSHFVKGHTDCSPHNRVYLARRTKMANDCYVQKYTHIHWCEQSHAITHETRRLNVQTLELAYELYKTDNKDQIKSTDKLYYCPCSITKAKSNALSRNSQRIIKVRLPRSKGATHQ